MIASRSPQHAHGRPVVLATIALLVAAPAAASVPRQDPPSECPWQPAAPSPIPRIEGPSVVVDGEIHVLGGFYNHYMFASTRYDVYDPATDTWSTRADLPAPVTHAGVALDDRTIWMVGGLVGNAPGVVVDTVWTYDVDTDVWSPGPNLPERRGSGALVREGRDLHYFGGFGSDPEVDRGEHWVLDLDGPLVWTSAAPLPEARNHLGGAELGGKVYAIGGQHRHEDDPEDLAWVHCYDPLSDAWTEVAPLPFPRSHFEPATFTWNGRIVVGGGRVDEHFEPVVAEVTAYDPVADAWSALLPLPANRNSPSLKVVGTQMIMTGGGTGPTSPVDQTYVRPAAAVLGDTRRVNAGGASYLTPGTQYAWCSDHGFIDGQSFENASIPDIAGTDDDELYRTEHSGTSTHPTTFGYRVNVTPGLFRIRLHFAEIFWGAPGGGPGGVGKRVFDVLLEDELVLDDLDIWSEVGASAALVFTYDVAVQGDDVDLWFESSVDRPKISAIEAIRLPDGSFANYCPASPTSTGSGAGLWFGGNTSVLENAFTLRGFGAPPGQSGLFVMSASAAQVPFGSGTLCLGGPMFRLGPVQVTDGAGAIERHVDFQNPAQPAATVVAGSVWYFQLWFRDGQTFNLSEGLEASFTP